MDRVLCYAGATLLLCCALLGLAPRTLEAAPVDHQSFQEFVESFYEEAAQEGITRRTYDRAMASVITPDLSVLEKAAYQPEFRTKIWDYLDSRVTRRSVVDGRIMAGVYGRVLRQVEDKFGVDSSVLLAIWSMESSYGAALLKSSRLHYVPRALATLAYGDPRRQKFARSQLLAVLQIVQAGDVGLEQLMGSWAGAMGQTQFIPTSFLAYGIDMDGDGRRDIWHSVADALATAANLLHRNKWRLGEPWGYEVILPVQGAGYDGETRTLSQWRKLGFLRPRGQGFADLQMKAELKIIGGPGGPGFLLLRNFFILKRYNNSDFYALAVSLLADRLSGKKGLQQDWPRPPGTLSVEEKFELQELLTQKGLYSGALDGQIGRNTRKGIRAFQLQAGLPVKGEPTQELLMILKKEVKK